LARSLPRESFARCSRSQLSRSATRGAFNSCRTARRRSALWPLIERSISNSASMRRTASVLDSRQVDSLLTIPI
jgi:hypothetical protein